MSRNVKISLALGVLFALALTVLVLVDRDEESTAQSPERDTASVAQVVRPDSHRLSEVPGSKATFVEFLDFECEACGAMFPIVEQLRAEYGDRVEFVVRYFPIQSHFNAERAARAVEAAARQGEFEQMYRKMYETQPTWSEQRVPKDDVFRGFAAELGLDMAKFDADYTDPATLERIRADVTDGTALGVEGTPTFFVNGEKLVPRSYDDFTRALDNALG